VYSITRQEATMLRLLTILALVLALPAAAVDLGSSAPPKPAIDHLAPPSDADVIRQGGDTIADAVEVTVPYSGTGTTAGYADDYDATCPFGGWSPDVVYTTTPTVDIVVDIDLFGSTYDTKVFVYDADMTLIACNDDFYPDYVSKLEEVPLAAGMQYYVVIDGYGGAAGDYVLTITENVPCIIDCPAGAELEGEPPLVDGYDDVFNGGCGSAAIFPFGVITQPVFCGVSGWYLTDDGFEARDTDWFELVVPDVGFIEIVGDAERETYLLELGPQDCGSVGVVQDVIVGPCAPATLTIAGAPGSVVWFWVGPTFFVGPVNEYNYVLYTNLGAVATESSSWSAVKGLFN
jgi:hypothetical protein